MQKTAARLENRYVESAVYMDTLVTIDVPDPRSRDECAAQVDRAFGWFAHVEKLCSRFDENSELSRLSASPPGTPVSVSRMLFELVDFACAVAAVSRGAFDPTIGRTMQKHGFNRNYRTGAECSSDIEDAVCSYQDVLLDSDNCTIALMRPMVLDLGAVAKGLAIDLAGHELNSYEHFLVNAGGDILARGYHSPGTPWGIGIRHPRQPEELIDALVVTGAAVCTSGDYERSGEAGHHIL
ncbi:MAG: FAD:protein FMN transferase, partial [Chloroflexota bacterium]